MVCVFNEALQNKVMAVVETKYVTLSLVKTVYSIIEENGIVVVAKIKAEYIGDKEKGQCTVLHRVQISPPNELTSLKVASDRYKEVTKLFNQLVNEKQDKRA